MPNAGYIRGATFERWIVNKLRASGYEATRAAGSKGAWDVICWNAVRVRFIQASAGPGKGPLTRQSLAMAIVPSGSAKEIWRKRAGGALEVIRWDDRSGCWVDVEEWWA